MPHKVPSMSGKLAQAACLSGQMDHRLPARAGPSHRDGTHSRAVAGSAWARTRTPTHTHTHTLPPSPHPSTQPPLTTFLTHQGTGCAGPGGAVVLRGFPLEGWKGKVQTHVLTRGPARMSGQLTPENEPYFSVNHIFHELQHHQPRGLLGAFLSRYFPLLTRRPRDRLTNGHTLARAGKQLPASLQALQSS